MGEAMRHVPDGAEEFRAPDESEGEPEIIGSVGGEGQSPEAKREALAAQLSDITDFVTDDNPDNSVGFGAEAKAGYMLSQERRFVDEKGGLKPDFYDKMCIQLSGNDLISYTGFEGPTAEHEDQFTDHAQIQESDREKMRPGTFNENSGVLVIVGEQGQTFVTPANQFTRRILEKTGMTVDGGLHVPITGDSRFINENRDATWTKLAGDSRKMKAQKRITLAGEEKEIVAEEYWQDRKGPSAHWRKMWQEAKAEEPATGSADDSQSNTSEPPPQGYATPKPPPEDSPRSSGRVL